MVGFEIEKIGYFLGLFDDGGGFPLESFHFFDAAYEISAFFNGIDVTLCDELGIRVFYGHDADFQVLRKAALAGQLLSCGKRSRKNIAFDAFVEVLI